MTQPTPDAEKRSLEQNQVILQNLAEIVAKTEFKGFQAQQILDCRNFVDELLKQTEEHLNKLNAEAEPETETTGEAAEE